MLQYLKGTPRKGILLKRNRGLVLEEYIGNSYAGSIIDKRSTTSYCTFLANNLVLQMSKIQNMVAGSSVEIEFWTMAKGAGELL